MNVYVQNHRLDEQGPASLPTLLDLCDDDASRGRILALRRFGLTEARLRGDDVLVARTGYTGEDVGFELYVHPDRMQKLWDAILEASDANPGATVELSSGPRVHVASKLNCPV